MSRNPDRNVETSSFHLVTTLLMNVTENKKTFLFGERHSYWSDDENHLDDALQILSRLEFDPIRMFFLYPNRFESQTI